MILQTSKIQSAFALCADMAQLVEQRIRNAWVAGSSPASGSKVANHHSMVRYFFA